MSKNTITQEHVDAVYNASQKIMMDVFDKTLILACQLPNGFVIVEAASCVDPKNYNAMIGREVCEERIKNKIWELEGYDLQNKLKQEG